MTSPEIITRKQAKQAGLSRYFSGRPCKHGHIAERLTVNGQCIECARVKSKKDYWAKREENLRRQKKYRESNQALKDRRKAQRERDDPGLAARRAERIRVKALRDGAKTAGESQFYTGVPCSNGHDSNRFVSDGRCVECNRLACQRRYQSSVESDPKRLAARLERERRREEKAERSALWRAASKARQEAMKAGRKTYSSPNPCPRGHDSDRYTSTGMCVACAAEDMSSEARKEYERHYYHQNKDRIRDQSRVYYEANKERIKEACKAWAERNADLVKATKNAYKARRRAIEERGISGSEQLRWERAQKKVCYWCGDRCESNYHVDHYEPLSRGGRHEVDNLVIACAPCNLRKSAKDPYQFAQERGRLF